MKENDNEIHDTQTWATFLCLSTWIVEKERSDEELQIEKEKWLPCNVVISKQKRKMQTPFVGPTLHWPMWIDDLGDKRNRFDRKGNEEDTKEENIRLLTCFGQNKYFHLTILKVRTRSWE